MRRSPSATRLLFAVGVAHRRVGDDDDLVAVVAFDLDVAGEQRHLEDGRARGVAERHDEALIVLGACAGRGQRERGRGKESKNRRLVHQFALRT